MPRLTTVQVLNRLAEKTYDNTKQLRRGVTQRRNGMEDLYGVEFHHNGANEAKFYVSVSPDLVYYERFAFKLIIEPFESSVTGISGGGSMEVDETSLSISGQSGSKVISGTSTLDDGDGGSITPNPHSHEISGSVGDVNYGIKTISTDSTSWQMYIDGVEITDYLIEQHDGYWIDGEGIYPNDSLSENEDDDEAPNFYDILDVACMLEAEGEDEKLKKLMNPGLKEVKLVSDAPFGLTALLYLKYSHVNR